MNAQLSGGKGILKYAAHNPLPSKEDCAICQELIKDQFTFDRCGHSFCTPCITRAFEYDQVCPMCMARYGAKTGNQPESGTMNYFTAPDKLPGYGKYDTIVIDYNFSSGIQTVRVFLSIRFICTSVILLFCHPAKHFG